MNNLPYKAVQSGDTGAYCRQCRSYIRPNELRIATMIQSFKLDEKEEQWNHFQCFFKTQRPRSIDEIANFENLHPKHQKKIRAKVAACYEALIPEAGPSTSKASLKRKATSSKRLKDFGVENAKSGRSTCAGCGNKIVKDQVRVIFTSYTTEVGKRYGGQNFSHHPACFNEIRERYNFFMSGSDLPGFQNLSKEDQKLIEDAIKPTHLSGPQAKKIRKEPANKSEAKQVNELEKLIEEQTIELLKVRDSIKTLTKPDLSKLLMANGCSKVAGNKEELLDRCADFLTFGAIQKCMKCRNGDLILSKGGYACNGNVDDWTPCDYFAAKPSRQYCNIPQYLMKSKNQAFFTKYQAKVVDRALRPREIKQFSYSQRQEVGEARNFTVKRKRDPLDGMHLAPIGRLEMSRGVMKTRIEKLGGRLFTKLNPRTAVVISNEAEVEKMNKRMQEAQEFNIQVVPEEFLTAVENGTREEAIEKITSMSICDWGSDPLSRIPAEEEMKVKVKTIYDKIDKGDKQQVVKLKNGSHVDPESGLEDIAHVYRDKGTNALYNAVLNLIDIQKNKNSFFKMQLLEADRGRRYWLFRSWGRIGTKIGDKETSSFDSIDQAIWQFEHYFQEHTGNNWRRPFKKVPGKYAVVEVDYVDDEKIRQMDMKSSIPSKLSDQVQDLMKIIFDVEAMKQTMIEFELDLEKMPLGRLSKKQLEEAYSCLNHMDGLISQGASSGAFIGASNRFFSLIPHSFGMNSAQIIDTVDAIKSKREMIESLLEIEIAYSMINDNSDKENEINPLDSHFQKLKTELHPLDKQSEDFKIIQQYVENTHAPTHDQYKLEIEEVFKVYRKGELKRYRPFKKLHNRQLLWHGSRVPNFAGILSGGLKIAPPEAPSSGYMFGKGIYFADMASKSANYCATTPNNNTGLMLLSEVALGNMQEMTKATFVTQLPDGYHSVKGIGKTLPNPSEFTEIDGVKVPFGKQMTLNTIQSHLLYNEYIVYDPAQVNIKYLLKLKFNYHHRRF